MSNENGQLRKGPVGGNRRTFAPRPKICQFCVEKDTKINYKDIDLLRRYVMEDGKIRPRRQTGTCAKHQRELAGAIKRARMIALLPFVNTIDD
jgi:small subunit ribosomal protein S18